MTSELGSEGSYRLTVKNVQTKGVDYAESSYPTCYPLLPLGGSDLFWGPLLMPSPASPSHYQVGHLSWMLQVRKA